MKLDDAVKEALESNKYITRDAWSGECFLSPALIIAISNGLCTDVKLDPKMLKDDGWKVK